MDPFRAYLTLAVLMFTWVGTASAETWLVSEYLVNPGLSANGYVIQTDSGTGDGKPPGTRYHLFSWNHLTQTGIFYQNVDEQAGGPICKGGPEGTHATYGRAGAGYDWYGVDKSGFHYFGFMYFAPDCSYTVGAVQDPWSVTAYPYQVTDQDADGRHTLPPDHLYVFGFQETHFDANQQMTGQDEMTIERYLMGVIQPGGPGTSLGLWVADPSLSWWLIDWLSDRVPAGGHSWSFFTKGVEAMEESTHYTRQRWVRP